MESYELDFWLSHLEVKKKTCIWNKKVYELEIRAFKRNVVEGNQLALQFHK